MATSEGIFHGMFLNEVKSMMYIFGDIKNSSAESALLLENTILKQMRDLMKRASRVSSMRGGSSITITDILFLFRKNMMKLKRLVKHIQLRDICRRTSTTLEENDSMSLQYDSSGSTGRKEKYSLDFLSNEDREAVLTDEVDEIQKKRLESLDNITKNMNVSEYKDFSETRQTNLHRNMGKFKEWLDLPSVLPSATVDQSVYSILGFIAYDTLQEIVELALLIKRDQEGVASDPNGPSRSPLFNEEGGGSSPMFFNVQTMSSSGSLPGSPKSPAGSSLSSPTQLVTKPKPRKRGRPPKNPIMPVSEPVPVVTTPPAPPTAIQPHHVHEAVRRYISQPIGPMIPLKTYFS